MPAPPAGYGHAAYVINHPLVDNNMVVTCGHEMPVDPEQYDDVVNALFSRFAFNIMPSLDSQATLQHVDLYVGSASGISGTVRSNEAPVAGATSMTSLPSNCAVLVNKQTATLGRIGRGRLYLPFAVNESNVDEGGNIDSTWVTDIGNAFDAWWANLNSVGLDNAGVLAPYLLHYEGTSPAGRSVRPITSFNVSGKISTQRRRLRR